MRDGGGPEGRRTPYLPSGYRLDETDPDEVVLRRGDGSEVAVFSQTGADPKEVEREAWEDHRKRHSCDMVNASKNGRPLLGSSIITESRAW